MVYINTCSRVAESVEGWKILGYNWNTRYLFPILKTGATRNPRGLYVFFYIKIRTHFTHICLQLQSKMQLLIVFLYTDLLLFFLQSSVEVWCGYRSYGRPGTTTCRVYTGGVVLRTSSRCTGEDLYIINVAWRQGV